MIFNTTQYVRYLPSHPLNIHIGDCSCSDTEITSLKLPNTLKSIGYRAFSGNRKLTNIDFGSGIKNIGAGSGGMTFFACDALTKVEIPSNVKLIGESAFANCWNLSNLIFNEGLESIGPNAFRNCNLSEIVLPKSVRRLCDAALNGAKNIEVPGIIPVNFLHAVLKTDDGARPNDLFDIVEVTDGSNKLFFPMYLEVNKKDDLQRSLRLLFLRRHKDEWFHKKVCQKNFEVHAVT